MKRRRSKVLFAFAVAAVPVCVGAAGVSTTPAEVAAPEPAPMVSPAATATTATTTTTRTQPTSGPTGAPSQPVHDEVDPADATGVDGWGPAPEASGRRPYGGNPDRESTLVAAEDQRMTQIRSFAAGARWSKYPLVFPYHVTSGDQRTLVLTERAAPYTEPELLKLSPQGFTQVSQGVYQLSEHLLVMPGATLHLGGTAPTTLRLASDADGFASIVNDGGRLQIVGTPDAPVTVTSWDRKDGAPDRRTEDGRAYVRSDGGQTDLEGASFSALGFWSGRTGGLAVLGGQHDGKNGDGDTVPPADLSKVAADAAAKQQAAGIDAARAAATAAKVAQAAAEAKAAGEAPGPAKAEARRDAKAAGAAQQPAPVALDKVQVAGEIVLPQPGAATVGGAAGTTGAPSTVVKGVTVEDGAYGLYFSGVHDLVIANSTIRSSRVDGVVLHRDVVRANLTGVRTENNRGDGLVVARAATQVTISEITAAQNARDGVMVSGAPLAEGPNAAGSSTAAHGDTEITRSTVRDNGRYGVAVVGGHRVKVSDNTVSGQQVGIVVRTNAQEVRVVGNKVASAGKQGIAVRDGVRAATVEGNDVAGSPTGVYVRASAATVLDNTVREANSHGVTVRGPAQQVTVRGNTISGEGPGAFNIAGAEGLDALRIQADNVVTDWSVSKPLDVAVRRVLAPLTVLWLALAAIVVATGIRMRDRRWEKRHPYADKAPVAGPESVFAAAQSRRGGTRPAVDGP